MKKKLMNLSAWSCGVALFLSPIAARADFLIEFLDGHTVTVRRYFEEGRMIKVYTPQGSIGFPKAEIKRILSVDANGVGIPLETVSLHRPAEADSTTSTQSGGKSATRVKGAATGEAGEEAAKQEEEKREKLTEEYQGVAQNLQSVWEKHVADVNNGAPLEVLEENRKQLNELNVKRHELIKTARQGNQDDLPEWAR